MKYTVHHYIPVIVCIENVEADSAENAVEHSWEEVAHFANEHLSADVRNLGNIKSSQYAEGRLGALVDVTGDDEYLESCYIGSEEAVSFLPREVDRRG